MSSFDPPLSRTSAAVLVVAAILVVAWLWYAAATTQKAALSTAHSAEHALSVGDTGIRP